MKKNILKFLKVFISMFLVLCTVFSTVGCSNGVDDGYAKISDVEFWGISATKK